MIDPGHTPSRTSKVGSETPDDIDRWDKFYAATRDRPPRPLLVRAIDLRPHAGDALDLGCGAGNDTRYLLANGYRVTAVDANPAAFVSLQALEDERLTVAQRTFAELTYDSTGYDLINAQYALPFSPPYGFSAMFARIIGALRPDAIFTGQLFGVRDEWNKPGTDLTFHTRAGAESLLGELRLLHFHEFEEEVVLASGDPHHGHVFEIIAQRSLAS